MHIFYIGSFRLTTSALSFIYVIDLSYIHLYINSKYLDDKYKTHLIMKRTVCTVATHPPSGRKPRLVASSLSTDSPTHPSPQYNKGAPHY
jgi:hypothetical protein